MSVDQPTNSKRPISQPSINPDTSGGDQSYLPGPVEQQADRTRVQQTNVGAALIGAGRQVGAAGLSLKAQQEAEARRQKIEDDKRLALERKLQAQEYSSTRAIQAIDKAHEIQNDPNILPENYTDHYRQWLQESGTWQTVEDSELRETQRLSDLNLLQQTLPTIAGIQAGIQQRQMYNQADATTRAGSDLAVKRATPEALVEFGQQIDDIFSSFPTEAGGGQYTGTQANNFKNQQLSQTALATVDHILQPTGGFKTTQQALDAAEQAFNYLEAPQVKKILDAQEDQSGRNKAYNLIEATNKAITKAARAELNDQVTAALGIVAHGQDPTSLLDSMEGNMQYATDEQRLMVDMARHMLPAVRGYFDAIQHGNQAQLNRWETALDPYHSDNPSPRDKYTPTREKFWNQIHAVGEQLKSELKDSPSGRNPVGIEDPYKAALIRARQDLQARRHTVFNVPLLDKEDVTGLVSKIEQLQMANDVEGMSKLWNEMHDQYSKDQVSENYSAFDVVLRQLSEHGDNALTQTAIASFMIAGAMEPGASMIRKNLMRVASLTDSQMKQVVESKGLEMKDVQRRARAAMAANPAVVAAFQGQEGVNNLHAARLAAQYKVLQNALILQVVEGNSPDGNSFHNIPIPFGPNEYSRSLATFTDSLKSRAVQLDGAYSDDSNPFSSFAGSTQQFKPSVTFDSQSVVKVPKTHPALTNTEELSKPENIQRVMADILRDREYFRGKLLTGVESQTRSTRWIPSNQLTDQDQFGPAFNRAAKSADTNPLMLAALSKALSNNNPRFAQPATDQRGLFAMGPEMRRRLNLSGNASEQEQADAAADELARLNKQYNGNQEKVIAAFIAGERTVDEAGDGGSFKFSSILPGSKATVTSGFGQRDGRAHEGMDIGVPEGKQITPPIPGRVSKVVRGDKGYGFYVDVDHGIINGKKVTTRYAHLSKINVKVGDSVAMGADLGLSGGTKGARGAGNSRGPHVHFEIRENGTPIDPQKFQLPGDLPPNLRAQVSDTLAITEQLRATHLIPKSDPAAVKMTLNQIEDEALSDFLKATRIKARVQSNKDGIVLYVHTKTGMGALNTVDGEQFVIPWSKVGQVWKTVRGSR